MKKAKPYWRMTAAELRESTREIDDPKYQPPAQRPTATDLARQRRAKAKGARPGKRSLDAKTISLTLEKGLIVRSDSYARQLGISRAELIRRGLMAILPAKRQPARRRAG